MHLWPSIRSHQAHQLTRTFSRSFIKFSNPPFQDNVALIKSKSQKWLPWLLWLPVGVLFFEHGFSFVRINGMSMQPTFNPDSSLLRKDVVLVNRFTKSFKRGDIVTFWCPDDPTILMTKRIIALEGDLVRGRIYNSGKLVKIPSGHCWVEGDDGFHSRDSNTYGPIPLGLVTSKVTMLVWPISRFGLFPSHPNSQRYQSRVFSTSIS
ncbi:hypothetical protein O181_033811 [Austropuccinia psidii MF-1]|uniref:Mitochondrial inner membrane protease subunit n=1 Tax=Austropuccinia psidii MF-1 TaxID=1389203 RepID=A0A9Q3H7F4_9BASI|nr:hypothetical protein [Austropuccinia psidii MF-1]